jgi:hypothetical protein
MADLYDYASKRLCIESIDLEDERAPSGESSNRGELRREWSNFHPWQSKRVKVNTDGGESNGKRNHTDK